MYCQSIFTAAENRASHLELQLWTLTLAKDGRASTLLSGFSSAPPGRPRSVRAPGPPFASAKDSASEPCDTARRPRSSKLGALLETSRSLKKPVREDGFSSLELALVDLLTSTLRIPPTHWYCVMMLMKRLSDELGLNHLRSARSPWDVALLLASRFVRMLG